MYEQSRYYGNEKGKENDVEVHEMSSVHSGSDASQVVGSADMFDENGNLRLIPVSASAILKWSLAQTY